MAPRWHTALLVALMLAVAATGTLLSVGRDATCQPMARRSLAAVYTQMLIVQWGVLLYVSRIGRAANALPRLIGKRWRTAADAAFDVVLAALGWLLVRATETGWSRLFGAGRTVPGFAFIPYTPGERLAWVAVALSVGFCEEVVYRGYLQVQFTAFTGSASVGVMLQAVLFGIAHGEQGPSAVLRIGAYGLALGMLARVRQSLLPGILCHVAIDLASGLSGM